MIVTSWKNNQLPLCPYAPTGHLGHLEHLGHLGHWVIFCRAKKKRHQLPKEGVPLDHALCACTIVSLRGTLRGRTPWFCASHKGDCTWCPKCPYAPTGHLGHKGKGVPKEGFFFRPLSCASHKGDCTPKGYNISLFLRPLSSSLSLTQP